jgi:uncharacterized membrane protein YgdD (TMEM256/DUF423 family)
MSSSTLLVFAAVSGFILVAFGAFGAHVLNHYLSAQHLAFIYTGLEYQAWHTVAMLAICSLNLQRQNIWFYWGGFCWALGIILFSGSLYSLALSNLHFLVFITPIGGVCLLLGWLLVLLGTLRLRNKALSHE